jgi:exodeoxyribonuclease VII large subunit
VAMPTANQARPVYTVSELTHQIKAILENEFPLVWVVGEISNRRIPASGHCDFTLKDPNAQLNAVMFKGPLKRLPFDIADGLAVVGLGRLSVYEPRGTYQIIFEHLEPKGVGALQLAFEQLKTRLAAEGLFDAVHKQRLPLLPRKIHIITSPTGAVVHDTIQIIQRRFPNMPITVIPASVQGGDAVASIIRALQCLGRQPDAEVAILARGGGSLEDLQAFNSEELARTIFETPVPIISAIGHETDFTIADFVADMRAPTPSAAAELVVPEKHGLQEQCREMQARLRRDITTAISRHRIILENTLRRLRDPRRQVQEARLRLDDSGEMLRRAWNRYLDKKQEIVDRLFMRLHRIHLRGALQMSHNKLEQINYIIIHNMQNILLINRSKHRELTLRLKALNPQNVLERGYSITRDVPSKRIVKTSKPIKINQQVEIQLASGALLCRVEGKHLHGEENF